MRFNVLSPNIGAVAMVGVAASLKYEANFLSLTRTTERLRAHKQTEFQGHVKARQARYHVQFRARNIVNAEF